MDAPPVPPAPAVQKALSCVSYDQYKDHYMDNFLVDDVVDFNTYIENNIMVRMLPCSKQNGTEINLIIPGENARLGQYLLASEEAKLLTHSLLESIWERAQNDECFGLFDESNVLVHSSGKAKFHHVPVLPKTDVLLTQSLLNARRIIRKMIFKQKDSNSDPISIPEDFKHLFDIIKNKTLASFDLFHIHPSLVPLSNEFAMLVLLYEELKNLPDSKLKEVYCKLPYIDTWTQSINQNNLLREKYYFFPGRYDDPLYCSSEQELKEKRGENFSVYMRNSTAHRRDQTPSVNQNHVNALAQQQRRSQQQQQQNIQSHQRQQQQQNIQSHQRQ